jgi:regulator of protease activity HflC (stomatin/prohibitin superfamily)
VHFVQPRDARVLVEVLNRLLRTVQHPVTWLHIPVPVERTDAAYFVPLRDLQLPAGTQPFLGLIHDQDVAEGALARITGRRPPETIPNILRIHREVCDRIAKG